MEGCSGGRRDEWSRLLLTQDQTARYCNKWRQQPEGLRPWRLVPQISISLCPTFEWRKSKRDLWTLCQVLIGSWKPNDIAELKIKHVSCSGALFTKQSTQPLISLLTQGEHITLSEQVYGVSIVNRTLRVSSRSSQILNIHINST